MSGVHDADRPETPRAQLDGSPPSRSASWRLGGPWHVPHGGPEDGQEEGSPPSALVSFHYLRVAVRRRWIRCLVPGLIGLLLGAAFLAAGAPTATTTLLLTRAARTDAASPMATDMSLLTTRTVAGRTIQALGLTMAPEDLLASVHVVPTDSPDVLQLTMTGPSAAEAVRRLRTFSEQYLAYRADLVLAQSEALTKGYQERVDVLQARVNVLTARIEGPGGTTDEAVRRQASANAERAKLVEQISAFQSQLQDAVLQQDAIKVASRVIDPPASVPAGGRRHAVLVLASGLLAGLALGLGLIVLQAVLSDRLWLRAEVASALGTTVPLSVRSTVRPPRLRRLGNLAFLPWIGPRRARRSVGRQLVARTLVEALPEPGRRQSVTVLCLGNSGDVRFAVVAAAAELRRRGVGSVVVDLTVAGRVDRAARALTRSADDRPDVFRPSVVPSLTRGPSDMEAADWDDVAVAKVKNGPTFVIADFDPAVGVEHLVPWSDRVIVVVTAGRSSVELVRTAGDLVRVAGLQLRHAVLLRAPGDDISSGFTVLTEEGPAASTSTRAEPDAGAGRTRAR